MSGVAIRPRGGQCGRQQAVVGLGQRRELVARKIRKRRARRLHDDQVADAGARRHALAIGDDAGGSDFGAAADEGLAVLARSVGDVAPAVIDDVDVDARQFRIAADEMPAEDRRRTPRAHLRLRAPPARRPYFSSCRLAARRDCRRPYRMCRSRLRTRRPPSGRVVHDGRRGASPARDGSAIFRTTWRSGPAWKKQRALRTPDGNRA